MKIPAGRAPRTDRGLVSGTVDLGLMTHHVSHGWLQDNEMSLWTGRLDGAEGDP
jgi:hypothetical protein